MNIRNMAITGFGLLDITGYHSLSGSFQWDSDQRGPVDVKRSQVLSKMYPGFGKLNLPDRLAFAAAALALPAQVDGLSTGITIGAPYGSLSTDLAYMDSVRGGTPGPALFSATLPSSLVTDIAIYFGIKGPDRVFTGVGTPALYALESAGMMISCGKCDSALVVGVWETDDVTQSSAAALFIGDIQRYPSAVLLHLDDTDDTMMEMVQFKEEKEIFTMIGKSVLNRNSCRIRGLESGWNGHISLTEGIEQENG
ncbi:MAG TPA: beta-ketoacyl synthase N-terminal-like domain-containing protein [Chitinispirillaceae bacterium]|nr:beta-ketoacyl synthase N-terminal-like domain-containing protein [Chitinispirillaceae bacterium]